MDSLNEKYIVHGSKFNENIPNYSFGKTVYFHLKENYKLPIALIDAATRKTISYKTLFEKCSRLAHSLQKYGITQNDVIAISSENSVYHAFPLVATLWLGATVTLYNPLYTSREVLHVSNISKPTVIFCSKSSLQTILQVQKGLKFVKKIIVMDEDGGEYGVESMESFIASNIKDKDYKYFEPVDVDSQQVAFILYSSGTTGLPKGVMLTHYNMHILFIWFRDPRFFIQRIPGTGAALALMPYFHGFGLSIFLVGLLVGEMVLVMPKFEGETYLKAVQDFQVKTLYFVPTIANYLARSESVDNYDLSHVEVITTGATSLSRNTEELLVKRFKKGVYLRQGYGMTETAVIATLPPMKLVKPGSVGICLPGTSAKVVNTRTGKSLGPGSRGELYLRGPNIMKGYAGDISSTNDTIDREGWLRTGDICYYDEDGHFYIVDRLKELVKYKGFQVSPSEIEGLLLQNPKIADAAVVGLPDEISGELPLAFIVKTPGQNLTEDDVKNFVAKQVAPYKQLRGGVRFIEEIPKNPAGKMLRKQLLQLLSQKSKL